MTRPLTEDERTLAETYIDTIRSGGELTPTDFVDRWDAKPPLRDYELAEEYEAEVPVDRIVGTERINTDRLVPGRLCRVLVWLHEGEYDPSRGTPPHLAFVDGAYYVSSDGNHRVLAHKMLGLDTIHAEVSVYR